MGSQVCDAEVRDLVLHRRLHGRCDLPLLTDAAQPAIRPENKKQPDCPRSMSNSNRSQPIRFYHRGEVVEIQGPHTTRSVLDWLREDAHCTGTKEGCNEGDCGACTVVIAELAQDGAKDAVGGLQLQTVNACIQFLPSLNGKALLRWKTSRGSARARAPVPASMQMLACTPCSRPWWTAMARNAVFARRAL